MTMTARPTAPVPTAIVAIAFAVLGCARPVEVAPPEVRWGEDACASCGMIVSEERHAASAVVDPERGRTEARVYDDIGCLLADEAAGGGRFRGRWVHDLESASWVGADSSWFVRSPNLQTPMGSSVAAFATRERAEAFAAREGGDVLDWNGLVGRNREAALIPAPPGA